MIILVVLHEEDVHIFKELRMQATKFSRGISVGFSDRGMGRGEYGIMQGDKLIARLEWMGTQSQQHRTLAEIRADMLPAYENACLFGASTELFDACGVALKHIKATTKDAAVIALLEEARNKALPPTKELDHSES